MRIAKTRLIVPEVVQTSAMDCGPASLKCLLEGFGIPVSYGKLREACQTDMDGTSIDTVEEVAVELGLEAEQIMVPPDYLLVPEAEVLPAIVVVRLPNGLTHFVVAWRRHRRFVQIMDPGVGRRWPSQSEFLSSLYVHVMPAPVETWREWAASAQFLAPLRRKLKHLGIADSAVSRLIASALSETCWRPLAALEAATRTLEAMVRSGGIRRGAEAEGVIWRLFENVGSEASGRPEALPEAYWSVRPALSDPSGAERLLFRGAVLVHVSGRAARTPRSPTARQAVRSLPPELVAALEEPPTRPGRELFRLLRRDGLLTPLALVGALFVAAGGVLMEAVLLRSLLDVGREFGLAGQRLGVMSALVLFLLALLLIEFPIAQGLLRMGRHLEARLRLALLEKIPLLSDRYFHSRLTSDLAQRSHSIHRIRTMPDLGGQLLRSVFELALTTAGIIWLDPGAAKMAVLAAWLALLLPLAVQPALAEHDLRFRSHSGALSLFYLDTLLGLVPLRTHRAERALRREHEGLLAEWGRAGIALQRLAVAAEGVQFFVGFGLGVWLLLDHFARLGQSGSALLLVYWALNLPVLGQDVALVARQYPSHRNVTLRLLEPLGAKEEAQPAEVGGTERSVVARTSSAPGSRGVAISMHGVSVRAAGQTILEDVEFVVEPGTHLAIVGPSGAGKSSLVGLLLGWHRPATGQVLVDGLPLEGARLEQLRRETAWVEPAVRLWNRSLLENLRYGGADHRSPTASVLEQAGLRELLEKLPDGFETRLGESGALVSGGEGQRVRLGRAMLREGVRLAILDEPFRGLDRKLRRELLAKARSHWRDKTLLCITHDVGETLQFERVVVVQRGHIVEQGSPQELASWPQSRYRGMLQAEEEVRKGLWSSERWRRLQLDGGCLLETDRNTTMTHNLEALAWPLPRLGEVVEALARRAGLSPRAGPIPAPPGPAAQDDQALSDWIEAAAVWLGLEAEPTSSSYRDIVQLPRRAGPALLRLPGEGPARFFALLTSERKTMFLLRPDLTVERLPLTLLRDLLFGPWEALLLPEVDSLIESAGIPGQRKHRARQALVTERLCARRVGGCWLLRSSPGSPLLPRLRQARLARRLFALVGSHAAEYALWILSWWMLGSAALEGRFDFGLLLGWGLVLATLVPFRLLTTWLQGLTAVGVGVILKQRLLFGALRLEPEEIRHQGAGQFLAQVIESEAVESLALNGGFLALVAAVELIAALAILDLGAGGGLEAALLAVWITLALALTWRYYWRRDRWTRERLSMTHDLVERLVGHRTRLAQEPREHWHHGEDQMLEQYLHLATGMDEWAALLSALLPRGWLVLAFLGLTPRFLTGQVTRTGLAVALGGILLAYRALRRLSQGLANLADARICWQRVAPLFQAAARLRCLGQPGFSLPTCAPECAAEVRDEAVGGSNGSGRRVLIEAHEVSFHYADRGEPVLRACNLTVREGDRLLLEGPSGSGKSTLASLLVGLRRPQSGLLLFDGLDHQTLGDDGWRRRVVAAPQFHENHVLTETFAFNLLMGRRWPPLERDLREAETLCGELGLGELLQRMPAGLQQMVGEMGWQLSHGERSRLFIARALLQGARMIVLDESFAALDPENLERALRCALQRASALLVIAHP